MSFADIRIIFICLILFSTFGVFNFLYINENLHEKQFNGTYTEKYNTPSSSNFFTTIGNMLKFQFENPELFFINVILFGSLAIIVILIGLRFLRGQS